MKIEEIKVGQKVMRVGTVEKINLTHADVRTKDGSLGVFNISHIQPYAEPAPERLFKKGDIVEAVNCKLVQSEDLTIGKKYEVLKDAEGGRVTIRDDAEEEWDYFSLRFKLVTPIEERKLYTVGGGYNNSFLVRNDGGRIVASFTGLPNAEALAHELADRLNREALEG